MIASAIKVNQESKEVIIFNSILDLEHEYSLQIRTYSVQYIRQYMIDQNGSINTFTFSYVTMNDVLKE